MIRKTKIIATIGPATSTIIMLKKIIKAGVNVCRLNFSHLQHKEAKEIISRIKKINQELNVHTSILADLQGPKIRVGLLPKPINLLKGESVFLSTIRTSKKLTNIGSKKNALYISYSDFAKDVIVGDKILVDDGKIELKVVYSDKKTIVETKVVFGGVLSSNKGVNLPNTKISLPSLTKKDKIDLKFIFSQKIEWLALSFVRSSEDVLSLKRILKRNNSILSVISKIEKPEALGDIDNIISNSDAVMVARGDLGVEIPAFSVPAFQKMIVQKSIEKSKPVIIATQMLESMTLNSAATRAEVSDVANSVIDGADAVMLSGETSVGKFPVKTVSTMREIIRDIERSQYTNRKNTAYIDSLKDLNSRKISDAICAHAAQLSEQAGAKAIVTMTYSGYNAIKTSSFRPRAFIYAFTNNYAILNKLSLVWGVKAYYYDRGTTTDQTIMETKEILKENKEIKKGDAIISLASLPAYQKGMTNMIKLSTLE